MKRFLFVLLTAALLLMCACAPAEVPENTGSDAHAEDVPPEETVSIIYVSDTQCDPMSGFDYSGWTKLLQTAAETAPEAEILIIGGDVVDDGDDEAEWQAFLDAGGGLFESYTVYTVPGNHTTDAEYSAQLFSQPRSDIEGLEANFYSIDIGSIHFLMLDSVVMGTLDEEKVQKISAWLESDLAASDAKFTVAVQHHPITSLNGGYKDENRAETMRRNYLPIMKQHGLQLVLCGHQHVYSRTVPEDGVTQIMGVAGGKTYNLEERDDVEFFLTGSAVFSVIETGDDSFSVTTYDSDGKEIDSAVFD